MSIQSPSPAEIEDFIARHNLLREEFAVMVGVKVGAVYRWLSATTVAPPMLCRALRDLEKELEKKP